MNQATVKYRDFVLLALFTAIVFVLGLTPLGMVPLGLIKATTLHIPVIIGCLLLGPRYGAVLGAMFGLVSFLSNTMSPAVLSFAFTPLVPVPGTPNGSPLSLVICFVPRILVGVVPWFVYRGLQKLMKESSRGEILSMAIAGASGAILNTGLVMSLIYFLFRDAYASVNGIPVEAVAGVVLGVVGTNGVAETALAAVLTPAIGKILLSLKRRRM
ncbi:ECF transporter S component [Anaeromassilibacillus sp. An200]|uniref:ECF transporter S component n=1 Tax=Anaeromassilibacillus sp. An200 TaxID=1965587 RepID=UPI000B3A021E|nr:ECF transporter S component [Anaeromassilibacillus sp. An200]OUP12484.1 ECF transporter S component [Anaeromassilibacillus sp. An200]